MLRIRRLRRAVESHTAGTRAWIGTTGGRTGKDEARATPALDVGDGLLQLLPTTPISATGVAKSNTDQGQWLTKEVDTQDTSYGRGHH